MLLGHILRRPAGADVRDRGSALAAVVGIVAISGIMAAALLTGAMFSTGLTSASRAAVQALAAAEGGIDHAAANLGTCAGGVIASAPGTRPQFSVAVAHRGSITGPWTPGCPPAEALEVRLVATGFADHPGAAGHDRGNARRMEAVLRAQLPRAIVGDRGISNSGALKLAVVAGRPADIGTNGDFRCSGTFEHWGTLYVRGTYAPNNLNCQTYGTVVTGAAVDPEAPENIFPRLRKTDRRWPTATRTLAQVKTSFGSTSTDPCSLDLSGPATSAPTVVLAHEPIVVDATGCPNGYSMALDAKLVLHGDVVIFAEKLTTTSRKTLTITSGDGRPHKLYFVKPWPADRAGGCPSPTPSDFAFNGILHSGDNVGGVVLYSSTTITAGSLSSKKFPGQIYACAVDMQGSTELLFSPTGPRLLLAKRDVG